MGAPIAYVAESDADLQEAKSKVGAASNGNGAAPAQKEVPKEETAKVEAPAAARSEAATTTAPPPPPPSSAPAPAAAAPAPQKRADGRVIATPYAKKLAKELGVDLNNLSGSGPAGRITASDVEGFKGGNGATTTQAPTPAPMPTPAIASEPATKAAAPSAGPSTTVSELKGTTEPFNALQAAVAKNMVESLKVSKQQKSVSVQLQ